MTPLRARAELAARVGYEAVRAYVNATPGQRPNPLPWDAAPPSWRAVSITTAETLLACPSCRRPGIVHDAWMTVKADQGWRYGPERDEARRLSPLMVPYGDLPERERAKDRLFQAAVRALVPRDPPPPHHFEPPVRSI